MHSRTSVLILLSLLIVWRMPELKRIAEFSYVMIKATRPLLSSEESTKHEYIQAVSALKRFSGDQSADYTLGMIFFKQGDLTNAVEMFRHTARQSPRALALVFQKRASYYQRKEDHRMAERSYRAALGICPGVVENYIGLSRVLYSQGDVGQASHVLAYAATIISPGQAEHYALLGEMYTWKREWLDATAAYRQAVTMKPENGDWQTALAYSLLQTEGPAAAARYLAERVRDNNDWVWGLSLYSGILLSLGECNEGLVQLDRAVKQGLPESNAEGLIAKAVECYHGSAIKH